MSDKATRSIEDRAIEDRTIEDEEREAVAREHRQAGGSGSYATGCAIAALLVFFPVVLYFGFFVAIFVDEVVLQTNAILPNIPEEIEDGLETIYTPLIYLVQVMGLVP